MQLLIAKDFGGRSRTLEGVEAKAALGQPAVVVEHGLHACPVALAVAGLGHLPVAVAHLCDEEYVTL